MYSYHVAVNCCGGTHPAVSSSSPGVERIRGHPADRVNSFAGRWLPDNEKDVVGRW